MSQIMIEGKPYTPNRYGNYWERKAHRLQQAKLKADEKSAVAGTQSIIADSVEPFRVGDGRCRVPHGPLDRGLQGPA